MSQETDRRAHRRLNLRLAVLCRKVGAGAERPYTGNTLNISPSGALMQISGMKLFKGEMLNIEIAIPPARDLLKNGGRFSTQGQVIRIESMESSRRADEYVETQQIAVEFSRSPHLRL
ncbi:MAG: PilZ domain-containing protein [Sedimentisphaerales bacterium]|nr:PilZ domain-containing protein [Sedimentisphaerales bacterium]